MREQQPGTIRLTFEIDPAYANTLISVAGEIATQHAVTAELIRVTPNRSSVNIKYPWKDSLGEYFTEIEDSEKGILKLITAKNLADFATANSISNPHYTDNIIRNVRNNIMNPRREVTRTPSRLEGEGYKKYWQRYKEMGGIKLERVDDLLELLEDKTKSFYNLGMSRRKFLIGYLKKTLEHLDGSQDK